MTFNDDARFDTSKVSKRSGGRKAAIGGGGSIAVILLVVVAQQFGLDLSGLVGGGTSNIAVDGSYGPQTRAAVKKFQAANNLTVTGKVGPRTWRALASYCGSD